MQLHIRRFTGLVSHNDKELSLGKRKKIKILIPLLLSLFAAGTLLLSFVFEEAETVLAFVSGGLFFGSLVLLSVKYMANGRKSGDLPSLSGSYYSFHPYQAAAPVLFIAAGIFAVFITGANRMSFSDS
ncbi:MAG: hypothetical protein MUD02_08945, partial [Bacteroidales bacterium]|nr:hypothetical protein [Bacteroidales bacterium]